MPIHFVSRNPATLALAIVVAFIVVVGGFPTTFKLERAFNHGTELSRLRDRDFLRNSRILQRRPVDFPVGGSSDLFIAGLYYTKVQLGSPPKEYYVLIDTGSDDLWVSCSPCNGCPTSSRLHIPMEFYDPSTSSTASLISCSDVRCSLASRFSHSHCSRSNNQCSYTIKYGDDSITSGSYVSDLIHLNTLGVASNSSADVVFGCSTYETGPLSLSDSAIGGIFGFGQHGLSIIAQLSSQGIAPNAFAHCLVGSDIGGGIFVIGQIIEPNMVYTPLVPSQPHYNVHLQSISVNDRTLTIDPSAFAISDSQGGTIIDSGTTLTFLPKEAFHPFVDAITKSVSQYVRPLISNETSCYLITSSVSEIFPTVSFNFAGGAIMILRPQDYLVRQYYVGRAEMWCIGFHISQYKGMTIIGELVLKDKLVVYDLGCQRIGWMNYDCSSSVNVSSTSSCDGSGRTGSSSSLRVTRYKLLLIFILVVSCYHNSKG